MNRPDCFNIPRISTRLLMVVVAVVGLGLGLEIFRRHLISASIRHNQDAARCRLVAQLHEFNVAMADSERDLAKVFPELVPEASQYSLDAKTIARSRCLIDHYRTLAAKYERAAHDPWLSVEPDPPEPD